MGSRPTFSLVLDTDNLAGQGLAQLWIVLASLDRQTLHPREAAEVVVVHSLAEGEADLGPVVAAYPWLTVHVVERSAGYYETKMVALERTTGEVVAFCDADCRYTDTWLEALMAPFADERADVVAGETSTDASTATGAAMAIMFVFPRFSEHSEPYPLTGAYVANNVAFRRAVLERIPIPSSEGAYRGSCVRHSLQLRATGLRLVAAPAARAVHPHPTGVATILRRFVLFGNDALWRARHVDPGGAVRVRPRPTPVGWVSAVKNFSRRFASIRDLLRRDAVSTSRLLAAVPLVLLAFGAFLVGVTAAAVAPRRLGRWASREYAV